MARFQKGQSGNAAGKPAGTRNKATMMVLNLMQSGAVAITKVVIESAKGGDLAAARLVLERLAPPMRERPISIALPETATAEGIDKASQAVLDAAATGDLLLGEAQILTSIIDSRRKALEMLELEQRIAALETRNVTA